MSAVDVGIRNRFSINNVVTPAWEIMKGNFALFFAIAVLMALPIPLVLQFYDPRPPNPEAFHGDALEAEYWNRLFDAVAVTILAEAVLSMIAYGVCSLTAFQHLCGDQRSWGDNLVEALKRYLPLLMLFLLGQTGLFVPFLPFVVTLLAMFGLGFSWPFWAASIVLAIPAMILMVRWGICGQLCVIERTGPIASLKRSAELTDGSRWLLFALAILAILGLLVGGLVSLLVISLIARIGGPSGAAFGGGLLIQGLITGYCYCLSVTVYQELRCVKEGLQSPAMMAVFD